MQKTPKNTEISVKTSLILDNQRKIFVIDYKNHEYLIFSGPKSEILLNKSKKEDDVESFTELINREN